jgi:hypothetical protein
MIPSEVAAIADLIFPEWRDTDDLTLNEVLEAAWRIHNAGYRVAAKTEVAL